MGTSLTEPLPRTPFLGGVSHHKTHTTQAECRAERSSAKAPGGQPSSRCIEGEERGRRRYREFVNGFTDGSCIIGTLGLTRDIPTHATQSFDLYTIFVHFQAFVHESSLRLLPSPYLHCPTYCTNDCTTLAQYTIAPRPLLCMPYTVQYWQRQYR